MRILPCSFTILTYVGGWRPIFSSSSWKSKLYGLYTCVIMLTIYTFAATELIGLLRPIDDVDEFTNSCFMFFTIVGACSKATNILKMRDRIIQLIDILGEDLCKPHDEEETAIQNKIDWITKSVYGFLFIVFPNVYCSIIIIIFNIIMIFVRRNTYLFGGLVEIATFAVTSNSLINDLPQRVLPFKAWIPYSLETLPAFLCAYFHQILANIICAAVCAANETLVTGLMLQACAQLDILRHRLETLPQLIAKKISLNLKNIDGTDMEYESIESKSFSECVQHHHRILQ